MTPRHIDAIHIDSFRGIKNLHLEELAPINILTGDNNSGKTSVLEVIESLEAPGNISMWRGLTRKERFTPVNRGISVFKGLISLFNVNADDFRPGYEVTFSDGTISRLEMNGRIEEESLSMREMEELSGTYFHIAGAESEEEASLEDVEKLSINVCLNDELILESNCYDVQARFRVRGGREDCHLADVTYISPVRHAEGTIF